MFDIAKSSKLTVCLTALTMNYTTYAASQIDWCDAGIADYNRGYITKAVDEFKKATAVNPHCLSCFLWLAKSLKKNGQALEAVPIYQQALVLDPNNIEALTELAEILSWKDKTRSMALNLLKRLVQIDPNNMVARRKLGIMSSWNVKTRSDAIENLSVVVEKDPNDSEALLPLGQCLSWTGQWDKAEHYLRKLLSYNPKNIAARLELALVLSYQESRRSEALSEFNQVLQIEPYNVKAITGKALTLAWLKQWTEATPLLEQAIQLNPRDQLLRKEHAIAISETGKLKQAAFEFRQLLDKAPNDLELYQKLANTMLAANDLKGAESSLKTGLSIEPKNPSLQFDLAKTLFLEQQNDAAFAIINNLIAHSSTYKIREMAYKLAGQVKTRQLAIRICQSLLDKNEDDSETCLLLARILSWSTETRKESLKYFEQFLAAHRDESKIRQEFADVLSWTGNKGKSAREYTQLVKENPDDMFLLVNQARVLSWKGNLHSANKKYNQVLSKDPHNRLAWLGLGQCQNWAGDHLKAERTLKHAAQLYPNDVEIELERALNYRQLGRLDKAAQHLSFVLSTLPPSVYDKSHHQPYNSLKER